MMEILNRRQTDWQKRMTETLRRQEEERQELFLKQAAQQDWPMTARGDWEARGYSQWQQHHLLVGRACQVLAEQQLEQARFNTALWQEARIKQQDRHTAFLEAFSRLAPVELAFEVRSQQMQQAALRRQQEHALEQAALRDAAASAAAGGSGTSPWRLKWWQRDRQPTKFRTAEFRREAVQDRLAYQAWKNSS